jgi:hypothetical protein
VQEFGQVRDRVRVLSAQIADLYAASAGTEAGEEAGAEVRILHVSDVHSNPLGAEVARRLADSFRVQAVLDTGDLTSFGYAIEARIGDVIAGVKVPYGPCGGGGAVGYARFGAMRPSVSDDPTKDGATCGHAAYAPVCPIRAPDAVRQAAPNVPTATARSSDFACANTGDDGKEVGTKTGHGQPLPRLRPCRTSGYLRLLTASPARRDHDNSRLPAVPICIHVERFALS